MRLPFLTRRSNGSEGAVLAAQLPLEEPQVLLDQGVYASWYMLHRLGQEMERARRFGRPLSVMLVWPAFTADEDASAAVLEAGAAAIQKQVKPTDLVGWFGDHGLLVVMPETPVKGAEATASRLRSRLFRKTSGAGGQGWRVRTAAMAPQHKTADAFLHMVGGRLERTGGLIVGFHLAGHGRLSPPGRSP